VKQCQEQFNFTLPSVALSALKMREWKMREQIAGVENAGVTRRRNPSEEIP